MAFSLLLDENFNGSVPRDEYDDILSFISSVDNNLNGNMQMIRDDHYLRSKTCGLSNSSPTAHTVYFDNHPSSYTDMSHMVHYHQYQYQPVQTASLHLPTKVMDNNYYHSQTGNTDFVDLRSSFSGQCSNSNSMAESVDNQKLVDVSSILHATNDFMHSDVAAKDISSDVSCESLRIPPQSSCNLDNPTNSVNMHSNEIIQTQTSVSDRNSQDVLSPLIQSLNTEILNKCTLVSLLESIRTKVEPDHDTTAIEQYAENIDGGLTDSGLVGQPSSYTNSSYGQNHCEDYSANMLSPLNSSSNQLPLTDNSLTLKRLQSSKNSLNYDVSQCKCVKSSSCLLSEPVTSHYGHAQNCMFSSFRNQLMESGCETSADEPLKQSKIKVGPFRCPEESCVEVFKSKQGVNLHKLKKHNMGKLYSCDECEFKTPRRKDLHGHLVSQHKKLMPGMKVYECKFCSYKCVDRQRLLEHEVIHTGIKKFSCPDCGKHYTTKRGLRTHFKFHSNDRPHKCSLCEADFKVKSKLTDHLKLVHYKKGEKPFLCGYCEHRASIRGNVNQHIRNIHKGKPIIVLVSGEKKSKRTKSYNYSTIGGSGEKLLSE